IPQTPLTYATAGSVAGDIVLAQIETAYDAAKNSIQTTTRERYHNATGTGPLGSPGSAQPKARVTYVATYPDAIDRVQATAMYGMNGGTALIRSATIPNRSDNVLLDSNDFDSAGNLHATTDPAETITCFAYDDAGREVQKQLNCTVSSSSSSSS